jgi:hypothetical protein
MKIFGVLLLSSAIASAMAQPMLGARISAAEAKNHLGENLTVCGRIASEKTVLSAEGQPTLVDLDVAYPDQIFTVLIWGDDRWRNYKGHLFPRVEQYVCASGVIQDYGGILDRDLLIVAREKEQLKWGGPCSQDLRC